MGFGRKFIKKKQEINVGSNIYFLGEKNENFNLYKGKVIDLLENDLIKVRVINQCIYNSKDPIIKIIEKNKLRLEK